ncbi:Transposase-like protein [Mycena venus]|uniref:Transposase-like protein n=1 Tax=Mycena venus TaxID=2733690 RepID=A0A8H6YHR4_9AGAR|nr:Transposase-like protein [Mycena venus]
MSDTSLVRAPDLEKRIQKYHSGTRGCLKTSSDAALSFTLLRWLAVNVVLFCLSPTLFAALCLSRSFRADTVLSTFSPTALLYILAASGFTFVFLANTVFPAFMRYQVIVDAFFSRRSPEDSHSLVLHYTSTLAPILFLKRCALQYIYSRHIDHDYCVFRTTTFIQIHAELAHHQNRAAREVIRNRFYYFETVESFPRRILFSQTIEDAGIERDGHIYVKFPLLGGARSNTAPNEMEIDNPNDNSGAQQGSSSRKLRGANESAKYKAAIAAEGLDEDGRTMTHKTAPQRKRRRVAKKAKYDGQGGDDDSDDVYSGSDESSENNSSDSDNDLEITNEELSNSLPSKTVPATSRRQHAAKGAEKSRGKKRARRLSSGEKNPLEQAAPVQTVPVQVPKRKESKKTNAVYFFFEEVDCDADGSKEEDTKYYKCRHGNRKVVKVTKKMKGNLSTLVGHLQRTFPAHYRLCEVLNKRPTPPTSDEIAIANGRKAMDPTTSKKYLQELDNISNNIKLMLEQQLQKLQEPWDQRKFEDLVAKWVAACDQPFSAVEEPEFRAMLEYAYYHNVSGKLKVPNKKKCS